MARNYRQGIFKPQNHQKYRGDHSCIVFRSSWEAKFMKWCDSRENVIQWSSEEVIVPYFNPVDQMPHRYFVDFWVKMIDKNGNVTIGWGIGMGITPKRR